MELMAKVNKVLMHIPWHKFISMFDEWERRLVEWIDTGGGYLETNQPAWLALISLAKNYQATGLSAPPVNICTSPV
jgi:hypothetical protein